MRNGLSAVILTAAATAAISPALAVTADDVVCTKCVGLSDIAKNAVAEGRLAPDAVSTIKIQDGAVTMDKLDSEVRAGLANVSAPQFVGLSSATFAGTQGVATYTYACQTDFPGSRMCSSEEFINTRDFPVEYMGSGVVGWIRPTFASGSMVLDVSGIASVDQGNLTCDGWKQSTTGYRGLVVNGDGEFGDYLCSATIAHVACCR